MQAGLTEAAVRAKAGVAADAQNRTNQLKFGYTQLAQQASEGAANRGAQLKLGQMGADTAITQTAMGNNASAQQNDMSQFQDLIHSLQTEIADLKKSRGGGQGGGGWAPLR